MSNPSIEEITQDLVQILERSGKAVLTFISDDFYRRYRDRFKKALKDKLSKILLDKYNVLIMFGHNVVVLCFDRNFQDASKLLES